jgi:hypothetical protein
MRESDSSLRMILVSIQEGLGLMTEDAEVADAAGPPNQARNARAALKLCK